MTEMIERVARAQAGKRWEEFDEEHRQAARDLARAAIEAMREPTVEMCREASFDDWGPDACQTSWRAMIDVALGVRDIP